jgi:hypothetical protein
MDALARDRSGPKPPGRPEAAKTIRLVRPATQTPSGSSRPRSLRLKPGTEEAARPGEDLAVARIAERFAPGPLAGAEDGVSLCPPPEPHARPARGLDWRRLTAWIAIALLLAGFAVVCAIAIGAIEASAPSERHAGEKRKPPHILSASAAGKPTPSETRSRPKPEQAPAPVLPNETAEPPADSSNMNDPSQPRPGESLFSDVSMMRADGQETDIPFAAIYPAATDATAAAGAGESAREAVPQAEDEPSPEPDAETQDAAREVPEAKWIVLPNAINLRAAPARSARILGVMRKGSRLEEIDRKRGWVQVIDPETRATGWLYPAARPGGKTARGETEQAAAQKQSEPKGFLEVVGNWISGK